MTEKHLKTKSDNLETESKTAVSNQSSVQVH